MTIKKILTFFRQRLTVLSVAGIIAAVVATGLFLYIYNFRFPPVVTVEIIGKSNFPAEGINVNFSSFLWKHKQMLPDSAGCWKSEPAWVRKIWVTVPTDQANLVESVKVKIEESVFALTGSEIRTLPQSSSGTCTIEIPSTFRLSDNPFSSLGLVNHRLDWGMLFFSLLISLGLWVVIIPVIISIFFVVRKPVKKALPVAEDEFSAVPLRFLELASLALLCIPWVIFILGFIKPAFSIAITGILAVSLFLYYKSTRPKVSSGKIVSWKTLIILAFIALFFILFSGIGGLGLQNLDWPKHNCVLADLSFKDWPVSYHYTDSINSYNDHPLVYYMAYYMIPACFGKMFGWTAANIAMVLQSLFALVLTFCWILYFAGNKKMAVPAILIFMIFSGSDLLAYLVESNKFDLFTTSHLEIWGKVQFSSTFTILIWVPQHAIGSWLGTSLVYYYYSRSNSWVKVFFIFALVQFWSIYVAVGLLPFVLMSLFRQKEPVFSVLKKDILLLITGGIFCIISLFYYASKSGAIDNRHIMDIYDFLPYLTKFSVFSMFEWALFFFALVWVFRKNITPQFHLLMLSGLSLTIIPFIKAPSTYDFMMRTSLPALFIISIFVVKALVLKGRPAAIRAVFVILLIIGLATPAHEFARSVKHWASGEIQIPPINGKDNTIPELKPECFSKQYQGDPNTFFYKYISKKIPDARADE